jgi:dihydroxyacetone kinase
LQRLDGFPHIKVVYRGDADPAKVALVSGGGSGHEPAHAGFVGRGMLTAAVCGEVFASPSVDAVLAGILAVTGDAGCLLVVKNYTGDRLNFGLAAERAKALGKRVEMVVVGDDIALPDLPQPRGVAGTLFVHKIAGAAAESGASLEKVAGIARDVASAVRTYGVALDNCTVPGQTKDDRIKGGHAELGLGIHGEPGVESVAVTSAADLVSTMMDALHKDGSEQIALVNNLGAATPLEMSIVVNAMLTGSHGGAIRDVIGPTPMMTSLDMHGFSISLLPVRTDWVDALALEVEPVAWPGCAAVAEVQPQPLPDGLELKAANPSADPQRRALIVDCCAAFVNMEADLNALDAKVGDGDTGSTVATAARALTESVDDLPLSDITELYRALGDRLTTTMGGSSGVLLAILFSAAADASARGLSAMASLREGLDQMMAYGGAEPGHRTMVDALLPALDTFGAGDASAEAIAQAATAARQGADETARMATARSGRSAYVPEASLSGVVDPGAEGVARLFAAVAART